MPFIKNKDGICMEKIGTLISLNESTDPGSEMERLKKLGFECCQLVVWDVGYYSEKHAEAVRTAIRETGVEVSTLWAGWSGPAEWNFAAVPPRLDWVPPAFRMKRAEGADLCG